MPFYVVMLKWLDTFVTPAPSIITDGPDILGLHLRLVFLTGTNLAVSSLEKLAELNWAVSTELVHIVRWKYGGEFNFVVYRIDDIARLNFANVLLWCHFNLIGVVFNLVGVVFNLVGVVFNLVDVVFNLVDVVCSLQE